MVQYFVLSSSSMEMDSGKSEQIIDLIHRRFKGIAVVPPNVSVYPTMTTRLCKDCREEKDHLPLRVYK